MIYTKLIIGSLDESFNRVLLDTYNITHFLNTASEVNITTRVDRVYEKHGVPDDCNDTVSGTVKWNMMIPRFPESTGSKTTPMYSRKPKL